MEAFGCGADNYDNFSYDLNCIFPRRVGGRDTVIIVIVSYSWSHFNQLVLRNWMLLSLWILWRGSWRWVFLCCFVLVISHALFLAKVGRSVLSFQQVRQFFFKVPVDSTIVKSLTIIIFFFMMQYFCSVCSLAWHFINQPCCVTPSRMIIHTTSVSLLQCYLTFSQGIYILYM